MTPHNSDVCSFTWMDIVNDRQLAGCQSTYNESDVPMSNDMADLPAVWLAEPFHCSLAVWIVDCLMCPRVFLLLCLASLLLVCWIRRKKVAYNVPPGSMGLPFLGETAAFIRNGNTFFNSRLSRHGPIFKTSLLGSPTVVISGPANIGQILLSEGKTVTVQLQPSTIQLLGRQTVSTSTGARHRQLHKTFARAMQSSTLARVTPHIHETVREFVERWRSEGHVTSGVDELKKMALTLVARILLPLALDEEESQRIISLFNIFNDAFFSFPINLPGFPFRKGLWARAELKKIIDKRLEELVRENNPDPSGKLSILLRLISCFQEKQEEDAPDSLENFHNVALEMVFASFETLSSALCAICVSLAEHSYVTEKVRAELASLDLMSKDYFTYNDVTSATYTTAVRDEVLRLMPPIVGAFRRAITPIDILGYTIPPDWVILYTIPPTHHLSKRFASDHSDFNPDRWIKQSEHVTNGRVQNGANDKTSSAPGVTPREAFDFVPFGGGRRMCVGKDYAKLVLNIFLMEMVRAGRWSLPNGRPVMKTCPIPYPTDNLPIDFHT